MKTQNLIVFVAFFFFMANSVRASVSSSVESKQDTYTHCIDDKSGSNTMATFPLPQPKGSHGKTAIPQFEELPHIHKFHKERVKKMKRHHGKCWLISRLIITICHIAILLIGYLHVTH